MSDLTPALTASKDSSLLLFNFIPVLQLHSYEDDFDMLPLTL